MSRSPAKSPDAQAKPASPTEGHNFAEQLAELRRQQQEQYLQLTQQYQEQQDMLKRQQQQELNQYYKRQMILNANHKMHPPKDLLSSASYRSYHMESHSHDRNNEDRNVPMLDEQAGTPSTSNALSPLVRDRVRKKALDNINKKSAFEHVDVRSFTIRRQDEFKRWVYESRAYENEDEGLIPLRKAASEPNLKGRNLLKHRVRYKPCIEHHPLMPVNHPRHSYSPGERHSEVSGERREAISPPFKPRETIEGRVFSQGPRGSGAPPLFQSPSLPNINLNTTRSQVHFPTSMALGSTSSASSHDLKAPLHPGHPKYLEMLKTQYATNHRYLQHIMLEHGHDPKEIDLFHRRYLSKTEDQRMSDEERVKQLLESQNKLYLHLVESFNMSPASYASGISKSYSKLHSIENIPAPSSLTQSRSHDSLHSIKSPPRKDSYYKEDYLLQPHGIPLHSRFRFSRDPYQVPGDLHLKDHTPTRLRLKEHLREKQDATATMKTISLDSHFRRLEREHKIQEETEEDVAKEERKHISPKSSQEVLYSRNSDMLVSRKTSDPYSPTYGSGSKLNTLTAKMHGGSNPRIYGSNPSLHGSDTRLHNSNQHLYGSGSIHRSNPRLNGSNSSLQGSNPRLYGSNSHVNNSETHVISSTYSITETDAPMKNTKEMTGLVYDTIMLKHQCACGGSYPEHPESSGRLQSIWARLQETGVANLCEVRKHLSSHKQYAEHY